MQGKAVKKLMSREDLADYATHSKVDFLVQAFVPYEREVGIFYYRYPNEAKGHISGIVGKEFLSITGRWSFKHGDVVAKRKKIYSSIAGIAENLWRRIEKSVATRRRIPAGALWQSCTWCEIY